MTMFGKDNKKVESIKVTDMSMLGLKEKIKWEWQDTGLIVNTPATKTNDLSIVFKASSPTNYAAMAGRRDI